jgi:nitrite reductase/ring-hydroxylating ferredoxin subunit
MPDPTTPRTEPLPVCASSELVERGDAHVFDVLHFREPARVFVMRCLHVPTEMDWQHGKFLDGDREYILCATHGAAYAPLTGRCVGGPCGGGRLTVIDVEERDGQVYWYPSRDTRPAFTD